MGLGTIGFVGKIARIGRRRAAKFNSKTGNNLAEAKFPRCLIEYNYMRVKKLQVKSLILESAKKMRNFILITQKNLCLNQ